MENFFALQMDYVYFFYGFACIALGVVCYAMEKREFRVLPWTWLGLFGVFHGLHEWLEVFARGFGNSLSLNTAEILLATFSFIFLIEFGRAGVREITGKGPGRWILLLPIVLSAFGGLAGLEGFDAAMRYSMGLVGGLWAWRALFLASKRLGSASGRWLAACGIAFGLFAIATCLGAPPARFVPASFPNSAIFLNTLGFPIQLLSGVIIIAAAFSVLACFQVVSHGKDVSPLHKNVFWPAVLVTVMLVAGWGITEFAGRIALDQEIQEGRLILDALRNYFEVEVKDAKLDTAEKAEHPEILAALARGTSTDIGVARTLLEGAGSPRPAWFSSYLIDRKGRIIAGRAFQGGNFILRRALSGKTNGDYFFNEDMNDWSYYAYADVKDKRGRVLGCVIGKKDLSGIEKKFKRYPYAFLVDPNGVVFISSREDFCMKSLWPLSEEAQAGIMESGQFGRGPFPSLMKAMPADRRVVSFEGQDLLVSRQFVNGSGWSLVLLDSAGKVKAFRFFAIFAVFVFCSSTIAFFSVLYFTRESAAQISASERRYRSLVDGSPNCVMLFDGGGRCLTINKAGLDLMGYREDEIVGKRLDFLEVTEAGGSLDGLTKEVLKGRRKSFYAENVRPDGRRVCWSAALNPIVEADGTVRNIVGMFMDITEKRQAEDELCRYHAHLEDMVRERTVELSNVNKRLEQEVAERRTAEEELRKHREHLYELVSEQTADLTVANDFLQLEISERKRAEEELRSFAGRVETIINSSNDLIVMKDKDFRFLVVNEQCAKFFHTPVPDIIGKTDFDFMGYEAAQECRRSDEAAILSDAPSVSEECVGDKWLHIVKKRAVDPGGNISGIVAVMRDITDRKKAEVELRKYQERLEEMVGERTAELSEANERLNQLNEALADSEERFRSLFNLASDGILLVSSGDEEAVIADANVSACIMNGYEREEMIGMPITALDDEEGRRRVPDILKQIKEGQAVTFEINHVRKNGAVFPVEVSAQLVHIAGRPFILAIDRDITERRQAEEELKRHREHLVEMVEERTVELKTAVQLLTNEINFRKMTEMTLKESEAKFRKLSLEFNTLLDAMPDTLILISRDLKIMWMNRAAASTLGREDASALQGRHCYEILHNRPEPCEDCYVMRSFLSGNNENSQRTTSSGRLLDGRAFPIRDEDGTVGNVIVVLTDITDEVALQAEAMRASHLASLGELAAGVAHEINNPINGIINYAQILANKIAAGSRENEIAIRIIREGDRVAGIVRSLLSFARERKEEKVTVSIPKIISDTIILTETQIRKDGIDLLIDMPDGLPDIAANSQQIQQVFLNLISNARYALNLKYPGPSAEKKFVITGETVTVEDSHYVRITFHDMGTGISPDIVGKVMNPFFSTKPSGLGTGLGLSISHGIVRTHGGRISLDSAEGLYTRVIVDLPAKESHGK